MANLLDQASIVLTPTAYDDGKVLCAKPSEPPYGDFDFSRNSAATRVNAQGLVENVQILSSNLVQNGDFSEEGAEEVSNGSFSQEGSELITNGDFSSDTAWGKEVGWSISDGSLVANSVTTGLAFQSNIVEANKFYKATYDVVVTSGSIGLYFDGGTGYQGIATTTQTVTVFFKATTASPLYFRSDTSNFTGSIDNVSVREVGQDWALGTGWSIGEDKLNFTNVNGSSNQSSVFVIGKTYKITVDYTFTSGTRFILPYDGTNYNSDMRITTPSSAIGYTYYYTPLVGGTLFTYSDGNGNGSITNISVKEVGQNWEFNSTAILTANGMNITTGGYIRQDVVTIGKSYKLTYDIVSYTSGDIRVYDGTSQGSIPTSVGSNTFNFTAGGSVFVIQSNSASVNLVITNISVIEITDDTSLPRINYEGFSYQDALGSELVTNGDFATDSDWILSSGSTISGGSLNIIAAPYNANTRQTISLTSGKTYKIVIKATAIGSATDNTFQLGFGDLSGNPSDVTQYEFEVGYSVKTLTVTASATDATIIFRSRDAGTSNLSIDNVSVKEYLGQEVVPDSGCGSWLFEPQSTNLLPYSEDFSQWTSDTNASITSNSIISPDGTQNADKLIAGSSVARQSIKFNLNTTGNISAYVFAKKGEYTVIQLTDALLGSAFANFDLQSGLVGSTNTFAANIENYGNDWFKCSITYNSVNSPINSFRISIAQSSTSARLVNFAGNSSDGLYIYGAQIENLSYATSYIPTSGSTVTRNQDLCTNGGSLASINSTEGTLYFEGAALSNDLTNRSITLWDGTDTNRLVIKYDNQSNVVQVFNRVGGVPTAFLEHTLADITISQKIAVRYKANDYALVIDGVEVDTDTSSTTWSASVLNNIKFSNGSGSDFYGKTKALAVWKEALTDQELADLTYPTPTDPTFSLDFDTIATDFTFARGSEATYVDAQGLIQSTNELGPELVTNGDFATDSDWGLGTNWSISGGSLNAAAATAMAFQQNTGIVTNKTYKVTYTISNYVSGSVRIEIGSANVSVGTIRSANGTYTEYITALGDDEVYFDGILAFTGSIDNVSVKEYITATNTPRLDYSTGAEAFLLEPQRTNSIIQSENFSNATSWGKSGVTITSNSIISPDGTLNADLLTADGTSIQHAVLQSNTQSSKTMSIFAKAGTQQFIQILTSGTSAPVANYDLINGTANLVGSSSTASIENYGNGWYRCILSTTDAAAGSFYICYSQSLVSGRFPFFASSNTVYLWGAQSEISASYPSSYIKTEGSQVTRNQETCINATPEINSEEGVLYAEISALANDNTVRMIQISDGTNGNRVIIYYKNGGTINGALASGGSTVVDIPFSETFTNTNKVAIRYKLNDVSLWINGVKVGEDLSANSPIGLDRLSFNQDGGANYFYGNTKDVQVYTKALSDAELIKLTSWTSFIEMANALNYNII